MPFLAFVEVDLGEGGVTQVFYDRDGDGPDIITLDQGEDLTGLDFTVEVPESPAPSEPGAESPNAKATASVDGNPDEGNQGLNTVAGLGTNARVDVAVYLKGVKDLWSYKIKAEFDTAAVAFDGADAQTANEGTNLLNNSDALALFLPPLVVDGTSVEFGGSLLGSPDADKAPDGHGLGAVFHFITTRDFAEETTIKIKEIVLNGVGSDGGTVRDANEVEGVVTLVPLTATIEQVDFTTVVEVEGPVGAELIDENGQSLGRELKEVAAGDTITANILAKEGAEGITGFSARFEFNPSQISYVENSLTPGPLMPGLTALTQAGSGFAEVGGAAIQALGGESSKTDSGVLGTVRFAIEKDFSGGAFLALTNAVYLSGSTQEEFDLYTLILLGEGATPPPPPGGEEPPAALTPKAGDGTAAIGVGVLETKSLGGVKPGDQVEVLIVFNQTVPAATGFGVTLTVDPTKVSVVKGSKDVGVFSGALDLPPQLKGNAVTYGAAFLGQSTTASGPVAVLTFRTAEGFSGETEIELTELSIKISGGSHEFAPGASVVLTTKSEGPVKKGPDFTGDGIVDFDDFFLFAAAFGQPATGDFAVYDLDGNLDVGFGDFFEFAAAFGTTTTKPSATKPASVGTAGDNKEARLTLRALPSDQAGRVKVELRVTDAAGLKGFGASMEYDGEALDFIESEPAGLFKEGVESRPVLSLLQGEGKVSVADVVQTGVVAGEDVLAILTFRVGPGEKIGSLRVADGVVLD